MKFRVVLLQEPLPPLRFSFDSWQVMSPACDLFWVYSNYRLYNPRWGQITSLRHHPELRNSVVMSNSTTLLNGVELRCSTATTLQHPQHRVALILLQLAPYKPLKTLGRSPSAKLHQVETGKRDAQLASESSRRLLHHHTPIACYHSLPIPTCNACGMNWPNPIEQMTKFTSQMPGSLLPTNDLTTRVRIYGSLLLDLNNSRSWWPALLSLFPTLKC